MKRILLVAFATSIFAVSACASSGSSAKAADDAWNKQVAEAEAGIKSLQFGKSGHVLIVLISVVQACWHIDSYLPI